MFNEKVVVDIFKKNVFFTDCFMLPLFTKGI